MEADAANITNNIIKAVQHIVVLKQVLGDAHSDIDKQFKILFTNGMKCVEWYNVSLSTHENYQLLNNIIKGH